MSRTRRNVGANLAGNLAYALCQWVALAGLIRIGGTQTAGEYAFALAVTAPPMLLMGFGLRHALATDTANKYSVQEYLWLRGVLGGSAAALVSGAGFALTTGESPLTISAVCCSKLAQSLSDTHGGHCHRSDRMDIAAHSLVLRGILGTTALLTVFAATRSLAAAALTMTAVWMAVFALHDLLRLRTTSGPPLAFNRLGKLARSTWPLGVSAMLGSLMSNTPRYLVERHLGTAALGNFAALAHLITAAGLLMNSVHQAILPQLSRVVNGDPPAARRLIQTMHGAALALGFATTAGSFLLAEPILTLLYGPAIQNPSALTVFALAGTVAYLASSFNHVTLARGLFAIQPIALLIAIFAVYITGTHMVPRLGVVGAAASWGAAYATQCLLLWAYTNLRTRHNNGTPGPEAPHAN